MAITRDADKVMHGICNIYTGDPDESMPDEEDIDYDGDWTAGGLSWAGVGYTEDGVATEFTRDTDDVKASESITPIDVLVTGANYLLSFVVMEHTLEMMKLAHGGGTITTTAAGAGQIGKDVFTMSADLEMMAVGFEVQNDLGHWDRMYVPRVKSIATVGTPFALNKVRVFPVELRAMCPITDIEYTRKTDNES